jgi:uncharacterized Zn finger protein (UPF0148 family)
VDLDHCPRCGSPALVRRLGHTVCRDCEAESDEFARSLAAADSIRTVIEPPDVTDHVLADEVAAAIDRVLGRVPAASSAGHTAGSATAHREVP